MSTLYYKTDSLCHHGIKGQKWGERRFQYKNGSLKPAGVKRYAEEGYAEDAYRSNKSAAGKVYDKLTGANKTAGKIRQSTSTEKENRERAERYAREHGLTSPKSKPKLKKEPAAKKTIQNAAKKKPTAKKNQQVKSGASKALKAMSAIGKTAVITAARSAQINETSKSVNSFLSGDFGQSYSSAWAASKYSNVTRMFDD